LTLVEKISTFFSAGGPEEDKAQFVFVPIRNSFNFKIVLLFAHHLELSTQTREQFALHYVTPGTSNEKHVFKLTKGEDHCPLGHGYHVLWSDHGTKVITSIPQCARLYALDPTGDYSPNGRLATNALAEFTPSNLTLVGSVISFDFDLDPTHIEGRTQKVSVAVRFYYKSVE